MLVRFHSYLSLAVLLHAFAAVLAAAQTPVVQHPLQALTSQEYWAVYDVLRDDGKLDADTFVPSVLLHEPSKDRVLAWKPGDSIFREADVILIKKGVVTEARVDIPGRKVLAFKERPDVQGPFFESEFHELAEAIKKDSRVVEALKKRGITDMNTVKCEPLPFGYFALPELEGRRIMYGACSDMHGEFLTWGREIEGLYVEIDAKDKKVLAVIDAGIVPVPTGSINFEEAPENPRPGTTPIEITQPAGPSFRVTNGDVSWQNWRFRFRLDARVGPVVNLVRFEDGGRERSVMYEGSLSELYVPYMDPATGWVTRVFIDAGEFFPGGILTTLREGVDCPANASYFDAMFPDDHGMPVLHSHEVVCSS
jgi:primary-amine oxidase